jgi:hypothetical protein
MPLRAYDGGMLFSPLRWTERIDDCRANAMVVPAFGSEAKILTVLQCKLALAQKAVFRV